MTITLIILLYIASILFCRWINYILYKRDSNSPIMYGAWLIPVISVVAWVIIFYVENNEKRSNWFTGKHWDE